MILLRDGTEPKKKRKLVAQPIATGETHGLADLIAAAKSEPKGFVQKLQKVIDEGKLKLQSINIRDVYQGFKGIQVPISLPDQDGHERSIMASAFPVLAGLLTVAAINDAYELVESVGDELVTELEDPKKVTIVMRILAQDTQIDRVDEGKDFPEITAGEEGYEVLSKRNGRKISITKEAIDENDVVNIVERVNRLVEIADTFVEEQTLDGITDRYGSGAVPAEPYSLRPRTGVVQLYNALANNPGPRAPSGTRLTANALTSTTNLDAAYNVLANMRDDRGKRIAVKFSELMLVVPQAKLFTALKLTGSELEPAVYNEQNNWGPNGRFGRLKIVSTPKLDDISSTDWYLGALKRQFRRKWKTRFEYVELGMDSQRYLDSRVAFQARVSWDVGINAVDYNRVVQCQP